MRQISGKRARRNHFPNSLIAKRGMSRSPTRLDICGPLALRVVVACGLSLAAAAAAQKPANDAKQSNAAGERMRQAESLLEQGDYKAAEAALLRLAQTTPKDARVQYDLGFTEEHNGEDQAAAKAYAAAIAADPALPEPLVALGLLEARARQVEAARAHLDSAAKMTGASPALRGRALRALARLDEAGRPDDARDELLQATQLTGEQPNDTALIASLAMRGGDTAGAEDAYRRVLTRTPGDPAGTVGLASLMQHEGKLAEADVLLREGLAAHPEDPQLTAQTAAVYAAEGKTSEAVALLQLLRSTDDAAAANPALTRMLAHLELVSGNAAAAEPLYRGLVASDPNAGADPSLLDDWGSVLVRQNKFAEAQAILTRAAGARNAFHDDAAWGETEGHLAFAASRNHQPEVALQALAARATVLPSSPASLFLEATSHDALHQRKQAEASYRAFLAASKGKLPDEEFEARHRLIALEHEH